MEVIKNKILDGKHNKPIVLDVFFQKTKQPKPVLIFCHGYKGFKDWGAWNRMAQEFAQMGIVFVKFNFSHNGTTPEQPEDFADLEAFGQNNYVKELDDLETVIDWVSTSPLFHDEAATQQLALLGHSRGGGIVLLKAAEDPRIAKVITLASVCDFKKRTATVGELDLWKKSGVKYVLNGRTQQQMPHYYQFYENFLEHEERLTIEHAVKRLEIPLLILHGDADTSISVKEAHTIHKWMPQSSLTIIEHANHVFNTSHPWSKEDISEELATVIQESILFLRS